MQIDERHVPGRFCEVRVHMDPNFEEEDDDSEFGAEIGKKQLGLSWKMSQKPRKMMISPWFQQFSTELSLVFLYVSLGVRVNSPTWIHIIEILSLGGLKFNARVQRCWWVPKSG